MGFLLSAANAAARNLEGRLGVGLAFPDLGAQPALSARFAALTHLNIGVIAGFDTGDAQGYTLLGARANRHVDLQENLNAYFGVAAYYLSRKAGTATEHGYQVDALLGVEAFLPGLSDLGFSFETGLGFRSLQGDSLRTVGNGFLGTAVHYYF